MDGPNELDLTDRLVPPAEMAQIMGVDEVDVRAWIESGELDVQCGQDGEPRVSIREHRESAIGFEMGLTVYAGLRDRQLLADARAERRGRERNAQIAAAAATGVDIDALAQRLAAVAPPEVRITSTDRGMVDVLDSRGGGAGVDVALAVAPCEGDTRSPAERVVSAG